MREFDDADRSLVTRRRLLKTSASRTIAASPAVVWATIADHTTWTDWHDDYDEHDSITDPSTGLGATFRTKEWILRSESEITRWEDGRTIGLTIRRAVGWRWLIRSYYSEIEIEPTTTGSLVHYRVGFTGTILFWLTSAYSIAHSLGTIWWQIRSSLQALDTHVTTNGR